MTGTGRVDGAQYEALRRGVGAYPLARDVLSAAGPDAAAYLQGQCSQDLAALGTGAATSALVLEPDGKLCALVSVVRTGDESFVLATEGGYGEALAARLRRFLLRSKVDLAPLPWSAVAVRGAAAAVPAATAAGSLVVPFALGGLVGFDLLGPSPAGDVPPGATACETPAWEACRVEAGVPVMGRELTGRTIPHEAGLVAWAVSLTKGCYTGQELVARLDARGANVPRRLMGLVLAPGAAAGADPGALAGAALQAGGEDAGTLTSAAWSPALGAPVALGYVRRRVPEGATVEVAGAGPAQVRPLPLVSGEGRAPWPAAPPGATR